MGNSRIEAFKAQRDNLFFVKERIERTLNGFKELYSEKKDDGYSHMITEVSETLTDVEKEIEFLNKLIVSQLERDSLEEYELHQSNKKLTESNIKLNPWLKFGAIFSTAFTFLIVLFSGASLYQESIYNNNEDEIQILNVRVDSLLKEKQTLKLQLQKYQEENNRILKECGQTTVIDSNLTDSIIKSPKQ